MLPPLSTAALDLFLIMALLGMGNGAVFQLVPQRFPDEIGVMTGLVGAAGGLGGFVLPLILGFSKQWAGRFGPGFFLIGMVGFAAAGLLLQASREWQAKRLSDAGLAGRRSPQSIRLPRPSPRPARAATDPRRPPIGSSIVNGTGWH